MIELSAVTHREDFIFPALVPWTADVDTLLSLAGGAGSKMGFDATRGAGAAFDKIAIPKAAVARARAAVAALEGKAR